MKCLSLFSGKNKKKIFQTVACLNFYPECLALKELASLPEGVTTLREDS